MLGSVHPASTNVDLVSLYTITKPGHEIDTISRDYSDVCVCACVCNSVKFNAV